MPHHHGRFATSAGVKQKGTPSHHGISQRTPVSKAAVMRTKKLDPLSFEERRALTYKKIDHPGEPLAVKMLGKLTNAPKKNWDFFIKNYSRIAKTQKLPTIKAFAQMEEKARQKLYTATRRNIMRGNLDPFGEKSLLENAGTQQDIERRRKEQATTQDTTQASSSTLLAGSPTDSELSQSDATNAAGTELTAKRIKKRGRKINVYTSSSGKTSDKLILGKKSLLGMV